MKVEFRKHLLEDSKVIVGTGKKIDSSNSYVYFWHQEGGGEVAIKILKFKWKKANNAWKEEVSILEKYINEPYFCKIIGKWSFKNENYIVLKKYDGDVESLILNLHKTSIKEEQLLHITIVLLRAIWNAIKTLSSDDNVHQDIKPKNIFYKFYDNKYEFFLGDFWLMTEYKDRMKATHRWNKIYHAPEQFDDCMARIGKISYKADLYSLAKVASELLTGSHHPEFVFKCEHLSWRNPSPYIPKELTSLLIQCVNLEPWDRPNLNDFFSVIDNL